MFTLEMLVGCSRIIMGRRRAHFWVTPSAFLEETVTEPSVNPQDEAALATPESRSSDDAIEKRMVSRVVAGSIRWLEGSGQLEMDLEMGSSRRRCWRALRVSSGGV